MPPSEPPSLAPLQSEFLPPAPPQTSAAAILSLIFGAVLCIPIIPALIAIILGFAALRITRRPQFGGRAFAVAGILLGLLNLALCAWYLQYNRDVHAFIADYVQNLELDRIDNCVNDSTPAVGRAHLVAIRQAMKNWGTLHPAQYILVIPRHALILFPGMAHEIDVTLDGQHGNLKVAEISISH